MKRSEKRWALIVMPVDGFCPDAPGDPDALAASSRPTT